MAEIVAFRAKMRALDQRLVGHALRVSQLRRRRRNMELRRRRRNMEPRRRRRNMEELHRLLTVVAEVRQTQHSLQALLACSDFVAALDMIADARQLLATELRGPPPPRNIPPRSESPRANLVGLGQRELGSYKIANF
ncbi:hypothetical protein T484DRAFT_1858534 [Baffinella frigidus]|nr:hypothetical protein T484DRAFT_1858534 [Cryptophyta sp. CCMP2293]